MTDLTTASVLFQTAYQSRYTWDENFPGYSADVHLLVGAEVYIGKITIKGDLSVEVTGITDQQVAEGIHTQLQDMVIQRQPSNFEQTHGKFEFTLEQTDETGAATILVKGDSVDSRYKILGREISQISRVIGRNAFVFDYHENFQTGAGYIATRYDAVFRNSQTNEVSHVLKFEDTYEKLGNYYLITKQVVHEYLDTQHSTTEFQYSNIKLLEPASVY
jgi:hypothetical protein